MKNNRNGKASIITDSEYLKIRAKIITLKYKILLDLAWYTGERWGALVQLRVSDVYGPNGPHCMITFRSVSRKKRPDGSADTRQVPTHPVLYASLRTYTPDNNSVWMFPGRDGSKPLGWRQAYEILRAALERCGMSAKGVTTHSTRRTFITKLHRNGVSPATIRRITGHREYKSLDQYIEIDSNEIKGAIFNL
jgi:integrase/recombinase XerD